MKLSILLAVLPLFLAEASANAIFARQANVCSTKTVTKTATKTATKTNTKFITNTKMITNTKLITKTNTKTLTKSLVSTKSATKTITTTKPAVTTSIVSTVTSIDVHTTTEKVKVIKIKEKTKTTTETVSVTLTGTADVVTATVTATPEALTVTEKGVISTWIPPQNTSTVAPSTITKTIIHTAIPEVVYSTTVQYVPVTSTTTLVKTVSSIGTSTVTATVTQTPTVPACPSNAIEDGQFNAGWPSSWSASDPVLMSSYRTASMCGRDGLGTNSCYHFYGEWGLNQASSLKVNTEANYCAWKTYQLSFWHMTKDFPADCTIRVVSRGPGGETVIGTATQKKEDVNVYKQAGPWNFQPKSEKETLSFEMSCIANHYRWLAIDEVIVVPV